MKQLFQKYRQDGQISKALLVGQNMLNKNSGNQECFELYYCLLMELVNNLEDYRVGEKYLQQAAEALEYFSEHVDLDEKKVEFIKQKEEELDAAYQFLSQKASRQEEKELAEKRKAVDEGIKLLECIMRSAESCSKKENFHHCLHQLEQVDTNILKECMTDKQKESYESLVLACSNTVNEKLKEFEQKERVEYNLNAIEAYEKAFRLFHDGYDDNHKEVIEKLFAFDASKLFNETLVYYNHVYGYILSKLNDEEKFTMTKYAIMSEFSKK